LPRSQATPPKATSSSPSNGLETRRSVSSRAPTALRRTQFHQKAKTIEFDFDLPL
jgi:hypothetical protein